LHDQVSPCIELNIVLRLYKTVIQSDICNSSSGDMKQTVRPVGDTFIPNTARVKAMLLLKTPPEKSGLSSGLL